MTHPDDDNIARVANDYYEKKCWHDEPMTDEEIEDIYNNTKKEGENAAGRDN